MGEAVVDDIVAVLPPLLQSLEALGFIARHLNPPDFGAVMEAAGTPDQALKAVRPRLAGWPDHFADVTRSWISAACRSERSYCCSAGRSPESRSMRAPGLVSGVAEFLQCAIGATGFASDADLTAMMDDLV